MKEGTREAGLGLYQILPSLASVEAGELKPSKLLIDVPYGHLIGLLAIEIAPFLERRQRLDVSTTAEKEIDIAESGIV